MLIFVETNTGTTIAFHFEASDRVLRIKESIQEQQGLSPEKQRLTTAGGVKLVDHCALSDYDVKEGSTLYLAPSRHAHHQKDHIVGVDVQVNDTQVFKFKTEIYTTVKDLKEMIWKKTGVPVDEQHMFEPLDDNTLVSDGNRSFVMYWFANPTSWERAIQFNNEFMWSTAVLFAYAIGFLSAILPALLFPKLWW